MATLGGNERKISNIDDVWHLYQGVGTGSGKMGTEIELAFFDGQSLAFMTKEQKKSLIKAAQAKGVTLNEEPFCDGLEVCSIADTFENIETILSDTCDKICLTVDLAEEAGLKRSFFEQSPQVTTEDLLNNIIDNPRYQAFFVPVRADIDAIARYFVSSKSVQASVSYETPDHLLQNIRLLNYLAPFLFMLTANNAPYLNNDPAQIDYLAGMNFRHALGHLGGVPDYIFTAKDGDDLLRQHIETVLTTPVFSIFDHDGKQIKTPENQWKSLKDLETEGLNTEQNYFQVQSMLWRDIAIKPFKDQHGALSQHRYEARMFGVGMHQHITASIITGGLAFNSEYHKAITNLLIKFGFDARQPNQTKEQLASAYKNARVHQNKFFDVAYGTGQMRDFAKEFGEITRSSLTGDYLQASMAPMLYICETGNSDAKAHHDYLCNLEMVKTQQRRHDNRDINNPALTAGLYYESRSDLSKCA